MNKGLSLFLFFVINISFGQYDSSLHIGLTKKDSVIVEKGVSFELNSHQMLVGNALNMDFYNVFLRGGSWSKEQNDRLMKQLSFSNRSFFSSDNELKFRDVRSHLTGEKSYNWMFVMGEHYYGHALFSGDLLRLILNGNASYLGDTLMIGGNDIQFMHYRNFGFGISSEDGLSFASLSYVDGLDYIALKSRSGFFYSSSVGDTISVAARFKQISSNQQQKGVGFKLDVTKAFVGSKYNATFTIRNVGWMRWNGLEQHVWNIDQQYTGVEWVNMIQLEKPFQDNLDQWTNSTTGSRTKWIALPAEFHAHGKLDLNDRWSIGYGLRKWIWESKQSYQTFQIQRTWQRYSWSRPDWSLSSLLQMASRDQVWVGMSAACSWKRGISFGISSFQILSPMMKASRQLGFGLNAQYYLSASRTKKNKSEKNSNENQENERFKF